MDFIHLRTWYLLSNWQGTRPNKMYFLIVHNYNFLLFTWHCTLAINLILMHEWLGSTVWWTLFLFWPYGGRMSGHLLHRLFGPFALSSLIRFFSSILSSVRGFSLWFRGLRCPLFQLKFKVHNFVLVFYLVFKLWLLAGQLCRFLASQVKLSTNHMSHLLWPQAQALQSMERRWHDITNAWLDRLAKLCYTAADGLRRLANLVLQIFWVEDVNWRLVMAADGFVKLKGPLQLCFRYVLREGSPFKWDPSTAAAAAPEMYISCIFYHSSDDRVPIGIGSEFFSYHCIIRNNWFEKLQLESEKRK